MVSLLLCEAPEVQALISSKTSSVKEVDSKKVTRKFLIIPIGNWMDEGLKPEIPRHLIINPTIPPK